MNKRKEMLVIINPHAGKRKGRGLLDRIQTTIERYGLDAEVSVTKYPGHATLLARETTSQVVIAAGGDGTVNEVINGIVGTSKTLGVLPIGSGNDLIKSIGLSRDIDAAFRTISGGKSIRIDCGTVTCGQSNRYFVNGVGIGFDAAVAARTQEIRFLRGTAVYVMAVFQTLGKYAAPEFRIAIDSYSRISRNLLIAIGNGRCAGGGFYLTPEANVDDGLLDICMITDLPIWKILSIMPKVMKGRHTDSSAVTMKQGRTISVKSETPFFVHADGEIVGRNVTSVEVGVVDKAIAVLV
ncbi:MAG: diacylglycerol kinase family lipid kinase [Bacteroidetes bacterium]|nr:diacylglycerol kinase family lipid kinase [Bacteroidota bacterium]MCW5896306.1 diacylglycerol kinase family lipid kinase [Bacteroidota bacterium]